MTLMKDRLAESEIQTIGAVFSQISNTFDAAAFCEAAMCGLEVMELRQRVDHIIACMGQHLPDDFAEAAQWLAQVPAYWPHPVADEKTSFSEFTAWPVIDYVAVYGLQTPALALPLLGDLTSLFSAEFAIRPFMIEHWSLTHDYLIRWQVSDDYHQRRLVSEGSRPRLPWGIRLPMFVNDPQPVFALLLSMMNDSNEVVRRSVANNLNDIAKDHPDAVVAFLQPWASEPTSAESVPAELSDKGLQREKLIRHALRTLIKQGHAGALALVGVDVNAAVSTVLNHASTEVTLGDALTFECAIISEHDQPQKLVVDFAIHFVKANGKTAAKVFKWKTFTLEAGETRVIQKAHPIKPITTRRYYSGSHQLDVLVNGKIFLQHAFEFVV